MLVLKQCMLGTRICIIKVSHRNVRTVRLSATVLPSHLPVSLTVAALAGDHQPLCHAQRQPPAARGHAQHLRNAVLSERGRHLRVCRSGCSGPPQVGSAPPTLHNFGGTG